MFTRTTSTEFLIASCFKKMNRTIKKAWVIKKERIKRKKRNQTKFLMTK